MYPATPVAPAGHLLHDGLQRPDLAPAFVQRVQLAFIAGLPHHADAQQPRRRGHRRIDPAVLGQIVQRPQRKQQPGVAGVMLYVLPDLLRRLALLQPHPDTPGQQPHLRAGGQGIQHIHLRAGMLLFILLPRQTRRVAAAGQRAGDGDGKHGIRPLKGGQPVPDAGTGRAAAALVPVQRVQKRRYIQRRVIHKLPLSHHDAQRHRGHAGLGQQVGGGIRHDFPVHTARSCFFTSHNRFFKNRSMGIIPFYYILSTVFQKLITTTRIDTSGICVIIHTISLCFL